MLKDLMSMRKLVKKAELENIKTYASLEDVASKDEKM